jgi:flagellar basal body P-ring formation protein FlgA
MRSLLFALLSLPLIASTVKAEIIEMPVPFRTISAGDRLVADDFHLKEYSVTETAKRNYVVTVRQLEKMEALRPLLQGRPVALTSLRRALDVHKGEQVTAVYKLAGLQIQNKLIALDDGAIGETIKARNPSTGLVINAKIVTGGILEVGD